MQFVPKTDKELSEMNLWPIGEYGFEILEYAALGQNNYSTKDTVSKKQNEMIQLVVRVFHEDGRSIVIIDYLLESMAFKLKHAAYACGIGDKYETGKLSANDFIGKTGNLKLKIDKDKDGKYPDKNSVADYIPPKEQNQSTLSESPPNYEDEIPF